MSDQTELLRVTGIKKAFSTAQVLKNVDMDIRRGEVHALMGENGAGKSTLIKIITGAHLKDEGVILYDGREVEINSRADAQKLGIACIYQELSVISTLTVAQNILLGREPMIGKLPLISKRQMNRQVQELIDRYGFPLRADDLLEELGIAQRQMVEILKALSTEASLIIMDEPTASLSSRESEILFGIIEGLRDKGVSILYISHRLEEVYRLADRLTVLRDGQMVAVLERGNIVPEEVIRLMIGKDLSGQSGGQMKPSTGEVALEVRGLTRKGVFEQISFQARRGEILGFGGLVGSGRTEVMRCIFGADTFDAGEILLYGKPFHPACTQESIGAGVGLVPEDRRGQGFIPQLSINRNVALPNYDLIPQKAGAISDKQELKMCENAISALKIMPGIPDMRVSQLSGGNQQKAVLGKWLQRDLKILIVDEPTAGIDVGAKDEIYSILERLAANGVVILFVSSDLQELIRISTRILVMRKGGIVKEFSVGGVSQDDVLTAASGLMKGASEDA